MTDSLAFGPETARRPHLATATKEVGDLRLDTERAFSRLEGREAAAAGYPEIDWVDGGLVAAGGDHPVKGRYLLQGQAFASLDLDSSHGLTFYAAAPGEPGNALTVELIAGAGTSVVKTGNAVAITYNDGVDDDDAIATAVNANAAQTDGYLRAVSSATKNAAAISAAGAVAATALTGGTGEGWECKVSGEDALPANTPGTTSTAQITETLCTVTVPDLTGLADARAIGDVAKMEVKTDGIRADISANLA